MKSQHTKPSRKRILKATRVEVYSSLSEKFGSSYGIPSKDSDQDHKMNFQLDRLFTVLHAN